jgi:hypothetical protein
LTPSGQQVLTTFSRQTLARIHWLGKKQIAAQTNAVFLMRIWNEPESAKLEGHTLDKLAQAPWRWQEREVDTNSSALLRPLFNDVLQNESYLEIRETPNQSGELVFAIRLDRERAAHWETNLAAVLESLTGLRREPTAAGWSLKKHDAPNRIEWSGRGRANGRWWVWARKPTLY